MIHHAMHQYISTLSIKSCTYILCINTKIMLNIQSIDCTPMILVISYNVIYKNKIKEKWKEKQ